MNSSTTPVLDKGDLVIASAMPASQSIYQLHVVVFDDRCYEIAERILRSDSKSVFHKETGQLSNDSEAQLQLSLSALAPLEFELRTSINFEGIDPFQYESRDRRLLAYWWNNERVTSQSWSSDLFKNHRVSPDLSEKFSRQFDAVWHALLCEIQPCYLRRNEGGVTGGFSLPMAEADQL